MPANAINSDITEMTLVLLSSNKNIAIFIGFDALPDYLLNSKYFTGNELAKLAGVDLIPSFSGLDFSTNKEEIILACKELLSKDEVEKAWQFVIQLGNLIEK